MLTAFLMTGWCVKQDQNKWLVRNGLYYKEKKTRMWYISFPAPFEMSASVCDVQQKGKIIFMAVNWLDIYQESMITFQPTERCGCATPKGPPNV